MEKIGKLLAVLLGVMILAGFVGHANADPKGMWLTDGGKSHVKIDACGDKLCGEIVWLKEANNDDGSAKVDVNNRVLKNNDEAKVAKTKPPDHWAQTAIPFFRQGAG